MILEKLIEEYIAIEDKMGEVFGFNMDFAKKEPIACLAKSEYIADLKFIIWDLIMKENDTKTLNYLIEKYSKELFKTPQLLISLYKRYLTLDPANEQYYKNIAEIIVTSRNESAWPDAQKMYQFAEEHNWHAATETLNTINY